MTPADTSNELDLQNGWEENTTHTLTPRNQVSEGEEGDVMPITLIPLSAFVACLNEEDHEANEVMVLSSVALPLSFSETGRL